MKINVLLFSALFVFSACSKLKWDSSHFKPRAPERNLGAAKIIWTKELDAKYESGNMPIGQASPTIAAGKIFAGSLRQEFYQYRQDNGFLERKWKVEGIVTGKPVVFNGQVVIATIEGRAYCFDINDGRTIWERDIGAPFESAPAFYQGRLFFHLRNHTVISVDAQTGKMIWSYKRSVPYLTTYQRVSQPVFVENSLLIGFADGFLVRLRMEDGVVEWERKISQGQKFVDVDTTPLILGNTVWAAATNGNLSLLDIKSGEIKNSLRFSVSSNLLQGKNDKVYLGTSEGKILKVSNLGFVDKEYSISPSIEKGISFLSWSRDDLVVGTYDGKIFILKGKDLTPEYEFDFGSVHSSLFGEIAVSDNIFSVISSRNRLYVFERTDLPH